MAGKILLVEDEPQLSDTMAAYLVKAGYEIKQVDDGNKVMTAFERLSPDLVLLDLMLPNIDGLSLCREIRQISDVPIIMLTARVDEVDRLVGLEIGADDYVCKPYSPREVVARVKAVLRRINTISPETSLPNTTSSDSPLFIDAKQLDAFWEGEALHLTLIEFRLLSAMANEPRRVFTRENLMEKNLHGSTYRQ